MQQKILSYNQEYTVPTFKGLYQGQRGIFDFTGNMIKGNIRSKTAQRLIKEWALLHQKELLDDWKKAVDGKQLDKIAPLD